MVITTSPTLSLSCIRWTWH